MRKAAILVFGLMLGGCAGTLPRALQAPQVTPSTLAQARAGAVPRGTWVRWGGTIAAVRNGHAHTWIEVVQHPLADDGRPERTDTSDGRFVARIHGFLDPAIYAPGRTLTVIGTLGDDQVHAIGGFPYTFPVVDVTRFYLWRPRPKRQPVYPSPFWYDPWYPWGYPFY